MRETTITTDKNNFVFPPRKPRSDRGDVVFTSCSRCFPIDTQAIRNKILDLAMRGKLTEQLPEDGTAEELYRQIQAKKQALIKTGKIKKGKPLPAIANAEIPFTIPNSWKWTRWGDIVNIVSARRVHQADWRKTGVPFYRAREIAKLAESGYVNNELFISEKLYNEFSKTGVPHENDLMVSAVGTLGRTYVVQKDDRFYYKDASVLCLENFGGVNPYFLALVMKSNGMRTQIESNSGGTTVDTLTMVRMVKYLIPLPPLAEQHRIVERIEQVFSILDTIDALQAQYADNLTVLKTKLLKAAIQGKLTTQLPEDGTAEDLYRQIQAQKQALIQAGKIKKEKPLPEISADEIPFEIPGNWKWVVLGNITSKISSGNTPTGGRNSDVYVPSGFPFFREQNIYDDGIHQAGMVFISESLLASRQNSTVKAKDILLNITGGSIGRCALVPDDFDRGSINQHILIIRAVVPETRHYLHMLICSPYVQSQIKNNAVGDKDGFSAGRCKRLLVPFPPLAEQKRIVQKIDEAMKVFEN